ncbi:MAG: hypothetical protein JWQ66_1164 [Mucilaginibacter sp.]|jgi:hypothetical protein|nr:hypothetical protein [Mucilaginibacter sp.]
MNQEVTQYIENIDQKWQTEICKHLRETVLQSVPGVEELLQYGKPHYKKDGKYVCTYSTAKGWISFTLFNAAFLEVPDGLFEPGANPDRKTIKIREEQHADCTLLAKLLQQGVNIS